MAEVFVTPPEYPMGMELVRDGKCPIGATTPIACMFCPFGHMTECHHPSDCQTAQCSHLSRYGRGGRMNALWSATLSRTSPRYQDWYSCLQSDSVPLVSPAEVQATLGDESARVYLLDVKALNAEQKSRLVAHLARKYSVPDAAVVSELDSQGLPIRAEDVHVIVVFGTRAFL